MKTAALWFFGLFGFSVTGALIGEAIDPLDGPGPGALIGVVLFWCFRNYMPAAQPPPRLP